MNKEDLMSYDLSDKCLKVIDSCNSLRQLDAAFNYICLAERVMSRMEKRFLAPALKELLSRKCAFMLSNHNNLIQ